MKKKKISIWEWLDISLNGFFGLFFLIYVGKFGITNLILIGDNPWTKIFNIGIWYVLVMYFLDNLFKHFPNKEEKK